MHDTKIRVMAAVVGLQRFTVAELCERTGLRRPQVDPVLAALKKKGFLILESVDGSGEQHRPPGVYKLSDDSEKQQELANRLYGLRKAIASKDSDVEERQLESISGELEGLKLLLEISDRATRNEPLRRQELQRVDAQLSLVYGRLETTTYATGLDLRSPENQNHPLIPLWNHWHECSERAHEITDRWKSHAKSLEIKKIQIVTDPHFFDSAIFMYIFSRQPFREAGLDLDCELVPVDWKDVPQFVAESSHALGFYNRNDDSFPIFSSPGYWADLCVYSGYALLSHRDAELAKRPSSIAEADAFLESLLQAHRPSGGKPTIIHFGADSKWRLGPRLTDKIHVNQFDWKMVPNADSALEEFMSDPSALFVGGLPQRLRAERRGHVPVLDIRSRPRWFTINGLIHSLNLGPRGRIILESAMAFWYNTLDQLKHDPAFRKQVSASIQDLLQQRPGEGQSFFQDWMFEELFAKDGWLEFFPSKPADILHEVARHIEDSIPKAEPLVENQVLEKVRIAVKDAMKGIADNRSLSHLPELKAAEQVFN